jgi:hypothetical protein
MNPSPTTATSTTTKKITNGLSTIVPNSATSGTGVHQQKTYTDRNLNSMVKPPVGKIIYLIFLPFFYFLSQEINKGNL